MPVLHREAAEGLTTTEEPRLADFEATWQRIIRNAGQGFRTKRGLPFSYWIKGNDVHYDRSVWHTSKRNFETAYDLMPVAGPGVLDRHSIVGSSYVWAILNDPRIGPATAPPRMRR